MHAKFSTFQGFHEHNADFVKKLYAENDEDDYDFIPFLAALMLIDGSIQTVMCAMPDTDNPLDTAHNVLHNSALRASAGLPEGEFLMITFATAMWLKDPDDRSVRIGEGVMVISETPTSQLGTVFEVKRDPLPKLYEQKTPADAFKPRLPLLYNPNHVEH